MLGASEEDVTRYAGLMANVMVGTKCKGMAGLIEEGQR